MPTLEGFEDASAQQQCGHDRRSRGYDRLKLDTEQERYGERRRTFDSNTSFEDGSMTARVG
jgi:hypothetical protein